MFVDKIQIHVKAGNGGNGCVSFYRAKYVPNGGPDGGDGGRGGDVIIVADTGLNNLIDFRYKRKYKAEPGVDGSKQNRSGKSGEDIILHVPVGTVVREAGSQKVMADMTVAGESRTLAKGGRGGRGNQHFATPTRQAPQYAERGKPGREYDLVLELMLIADAGIIGFPNVGKSTLLSMVTNANPKIADYHFTTLSPNLGVVRDKARDFVLADIPGLIEGASTGAGLGHEFLRHISRTKVLIHVVDAAAVEGGDPVEGIRRINDELRNYSESLLERPQIIAANKTDIPEASEHLPKIHEYCRINNIPMFPISAAANQGLNELIAAVSQILGDYPQDIVFNEDYEEYEEMIVDEKPFTVTGDGEGFFVVEGAGIEKMLGYTSLESEKGFAFFQRYLREKGIIAALEEAGIKEGDTVRMYSLEFDYYK